MYIQQIYTKCLSEATYYIESDGFAAIIDPLREIEPYLQLAKERGAKIIYIFETHFHADFVSGHVDLAAATGATIVFGPTNVKTGYTSTIATDGQEFKIGSVNMRLIHTPGHTMESSCYLLFDEHQYARALFTGDTLFIGDVGRPDLAQKINATLTPQKLAGHLYDSLREKIMTLPDHIIVYPGHGAGSACGKNMSQETCDLLGNQKSNNYALNKELGKADFIEQVLSGLSEPPAYFPNDVMLNINGYSPIEQVIKRASQALTAKEFSECAEKNFALILDTREASVFAKAFIPASINIGIDGSFAVWAGTLITDINQPLLIVAESGREQEVFKRLARVGYDNVLGFLDGGFESWLEYSNSFDSIQSINADEFYETVKDGFCHILDVRKQSEFEREHLINARNTPLEYIFDCMKSLDKKETYYVHCAGGYRSMAFISLLKREGFEHLVNVIGGYDAVHKSNLFHDLVTSQQKAEIDEKTV
jgi:hydroxyacylglutathione hydrolase